MPESVSRPSSAVAMHGHAIRLRHHRMSRTWKLTIPGSVAELVGLHTRISTELVPFTSHGIQARLPQVLLDGCRTMLSPSCAPGTTPKADPQLLAGMFGGSKEAVVTTAARSAFLSPAPQDAFTTFTLPTASAAIVGAGYVPTRPPPAGPAGAAVAAVVAVSADVADGTLARLDSSTSAPVTALSLILIEVTAFFFR